MTAPTPETQQTGRVVRDDATGDGKPWGVPHNHVTRDIKPPGQCPACDRFHDRAGTQDRSQP